jgi:hypothetical protein
MIPVRRIFSKELIKRHCRVIRLAVNGTCTSQGSPQRRVAFGVAPESALSRAVRHSAEFPLPFSETKCSGIIQPREE